MQITDAGWLEMEAKRLAIVFVKENSAEVYMEWSLTIEIGTWFLHWSYEGMKEFSR